MQGAEVGTLLKTLGGTKVRTYNEPFDLLVHRFGVER